MNIIDTKKALSGGVRVLVPVPSKGRSGFEETPGYLRGRLRTHTGHGASKLVAVNVMGPGKNAKMARILPHWMIIMLSNLMLSVKVMKTSLYMRIPCEILVQKHPWFVPKLEITKELRSS